MDNNNFQQQFTHNVYRSVAQQLAQPAKKPKKTKFIIGAIALVIIIVAVVLIILLPKSTSPRELELDPALYVDDLGDITIERETLNAEYQKAVKGTPHSDYETDRRDTAFSNFTTEQLCKYLGGDCNRLRKPEELSHIFEKVPALNSYSLDWYLDQGSVIVMKAVYEASGSSLQYPYIIFARTGGLYYVADPDSSYQAYFTMVELFNEIKGVPEFYAYNRF
jgi:hypothetical protein